MRGQFVRGLTSLAESDERIVLLTGDLGFAVVEPFAERFPQRFINVGVAEQNMLGLATGLAEGGYIPFVYSIATFASLRPYEFIRNGPVSQRLPVRIVGVGGGFEYGHAGPTHHALEDLGVMRIQPGLTVIAPADHKQATSALGATWAIPGPVYYRLGKDDTSVIPGLNGRFELGRVQQLRRGHQLLMLGTGAVCREMENAASRVAEAGVSVATAIVASISPAPVNDLRNLLSDFESVMTIETHYVTGGLGSVVAEVVADHGVACTVVRCGVDDASTGPTGTEAYLMRAHRLDAQALVETALNISRAL